VRPKSVKYHSNGLKETLFLLIQFKNLSFSLDYIASRSNSPAVIINDEDLIINNFRLSLVMC